MASRKAQRRTQRRTRTKGAIVWLLQGLIAVLVLVILVPLLLIPLYSIVNPVSVPMVARAFKGQSVAHEWTTIGQLSDRLKASVLMSEDNHFCSHNGIDWQAVNTVLDDIKAGRRTRGASTITMQLVKNLFLWNTRSVVRKVIEMPLALYADLILSKRRIFEIYLNIAEWGPSGQFGAQTGAQHFFRQDATALTWRKAALLAVTLPNPRTRNPAKPTANLQRIAQIVETRARNANDYTQCYR